MNITSKDITFIKNDLFGRSPEDKHCILDLAVKTNSGKTIIIEMQNKYKDNLYTRFDYYIALTYVSQLKTTFDYSEIDKVIGIFFINQDSELFPNLFAKCVNYDILNKKELPDQRTQYYINLKKANEGYKYGFSENLIKYLKLISSTKEKEISDMAIDNEKLKRALAALEEINQDEELTHYLNWKSANDIYFNTEKNEAVREGIKEGIKQGIEQGIDEEKYKITKKALENNLDIYTISKITGLTEKQIKDIKLI